MRYNKEKVGCEMPTGAPYSISDLKRIVTPIAQKHGVKKVSVFGSYGRGKATGQSDVDLFIEKGAIKSLLQLLAFQLDIEEQLNVHVDVITNGAQDKRFLEKISPDEVTLYEQ